jgi:hypothetical protein
LSSCVARRYVFRGYSINTRYPSVGLSAQVKNIILNSVDPLPGRFTHLHLARGLQSSFAHNTARSSCTVLAELGSRVVCLAAGAKRVANGKLNAGKAIAMVPAKAAQRVAASTVVKAPTKAPTKKAPTKAPTKKAPTKAPTKKAPTKAPTKLTALSGTRSEGEMLSLQHPLFPTDTPEFFLPPKA